MKTARILIAGLGLAMLAVLVLRAATLIRPMCCLRLTRHSSSSVSCGQKKICSPQGLWEKLSIWPWNGMDSMMLLTVEPPLVCVQVAPPSALHRGLTPLVREAQNTQL